uniref:Uncharacterized protein n=1 Tax=Fopius arisanus TaxID=64838 RepID=A0A0C9QYI3_9HYME
MQLAATHRPHPPPVPPRPSRQVVAEALKRTPRLPCPTRQAPPPPNTKPWRPGDKTDNNVSAGRTVIYESSRITKDQPTKCNERTSDPEKTQECRGRSERIVNHRERQQQLTELIVNGNENSVRFGIKEEATGIHSDRKDSASDVFARVQGTEDNAEGNEQVCEDFDVIKKSFEVRGSGTGRKDTSLSSTGIRTKVQVNDNGDEIGGDNLTHVLVGKPRENSVATVATVVVVEEPERKVTINEDNKDNKDNKDSKDSKDNIQHQDWLEAGVRYSSTKITLAGDDSLSDRGNDYDNFQGDKLVDAHKNDEAIKISLDFSRYDTLGLSERTRRVSWVHFKNNR